MHRSPTPADLERNRKILQASRSVTYSTATRCSDHWTTEDGHYSSVHLPVHAFSTREESKEQLFVRRDPVL